MKKYTKSQIESIMMMANARVIEQTQRIGQPRHHYISEGDVIAVLSVVEKATQHRVEPTAPVAKRNSRKSTGAVSSKRRGGSR